MELDQYKSKGKPSPLDLLKTGAAIEPPKPSSPRPSAPSSNIDLEMRNRMLQMMQASANRPAAPPRPTPPPPVEATPQTPPAPLASPSSSSHFSTLVPSMISLKGQILHELHTHVSKLLGLNPSRREAVAAYLDQLARQPAAPTAASGVGGAGGGLLRWLQGPRSPAQNSAIHAYFEEVALIFLGQAILLKSWSDRGVRAWKAADLGQLNWSISTALKPLLPLDRDGWQLTRPNLYSWYHPSAMIQQELWKTLEDCSLANDGAALLLALIPRPRGSTTATSAGNTGYDPRFFDGLWKVTDRLLTEREQPTANFTNSFLRRERFFFSPTLRDGTLVRTGPRPRSPGERVTWIGLESSSFDLMMAELMELWSGPAAPPLWAIGTGLEAHSRDQMSLGLGSPKPSLLSRISEIEACDAAVVLEEKTIRAQGRSPETQQLRDQLEQLSYFRKLRAPGTSLGVLQACVAISKLRPGGVLWWAREEPLTAADGPEALAFLLERGKLFASWDFSSLDHQLPGSVPLFPRHLHLFVREPEIEHRLTHRPSTISLKGQIRSHVEVPLVLGDALSACLPQTKGIAPATRGPWQIRALRSPTAQKEWAERWPDPTSQTTVNQLERLRTRARPLASATTIRSTPDGDPQRDGTWTVDPTLVGLWIRADRNADGRFLAVEPLGKTPCRGEGFLILVPDRSWIAPLVTYLRLEIVRDWLDQHAERKSERWVLEDQVVRWIPVPATLLDRLSLGEDGAPDPTASGAPPLSELMRNPQKGREVLERLASDDTSNALATRTEIFIQGARAIAQLGMGQGNLGSLIMADGRVCWSKVLDILPASERVALSLHSEVSLHGNLPPHIPIARIERVKAPEPGILLATELGPYLRIASESRSLLDMIWSQLEGVTHPTWNDLAGHVQVPRRIELAEATANDLLRLHGEQSACLHELLTMISACPIF